MRILNILSQYFANKTEQKASLNLFFMIELKLEFLIHKSLGFNGDAILLCVFRFITLEQDARYIIKTICIRISLIGLKRQE